MSRLLFVAALLWAAVVAVLWLHWFPSVPERFTGNPMVTMWQLLGLVALTVSASAAVDGATRKAFSSEQIGEEYE